MVTGPLRAVLWLLGALAAVWMLLSALALPLMGRMMDGGMMTGGMGGAGPGGPMMGGMMTMPLMMVAMGAGFLALLGLVGVFVYLIVDSLRQQPETDSL
jgi:uncharacterized membrane protein